MVYIYVPPPPCVYRANCTSDDLVAYVLGLTIGFGIMFVFMGLYCSRYGNKWDFDTGTITMTTLGSVATFCGILYALHIFKVF